MQSPTALTPEPADPNLSAESSSASFESITSSTQQISISLTSSPLTVRTSEDTPIKSGYVARKVLQDILENISTTNNTPNKVIPSNETPLRATPLLTPPSSDERPQATFVSVDSLSSPSAAPPMKQVPLTEKILAQSALYFRAIQKQQKQPFPGSTTSSDSTHVADLVDRLRFDNLAQQIQQQQPPVPQLTYSQLQQQQQQQFFTRQFLNNPEGHKDSPDNNTKDKHAAADAHSLTAVELPNGNEVEESQGLATGVDADGANHIATIPKPDPLENPLNTTNVYINGLPLRWTDDDLYRLTRGFGAVKSVKLFTRHLEDKPSAYGFVLFNCVEDAERFIMTLRQHTSFHPSFAKTAKVPGTTNAKHAISDPVIPLPRGEDYADISITGLPLTIDMQTLRALFSPQVIKASKFFHTTGTPRRLVGFIRLEGPKAAQDIFDRLHGSNVLGWSENLSVQSLGSGTNLLPYPSEPLPSGSQTLKQENVSVARTAAGAQSSQTTPTQTPSIGVYQHQNVQINDFNRLFSSMQLSAAPHTIIQQDQPQPSQLHSQKQHVSAVEAIPQALQSNHSPYTPSLDFPRLHNLSPALSGTPQMVYSSNNSNRFGLGFGVPGTASPHSESAYNMAHLQNNTLIQDLTQTQQTQFQDHYGSSQQTLQALQAAVAVQDGVFSGLDSGRSVNAFGARQFTQAYPEFPWPITANDTMGGSPLHQLHRAQGNLFENATRGMPSTQGFAGLNVHPKFSLPPLSTTGVKTLHSSLNGGNKELPSGVPLLLPALTPSSPQASSEESSPVTPTFAQPHRSLIAGNEAEA